MYLQKLSNMFKLDDIIVTTKWWTLADCHFDRNATNITELLSANIVAVDPTSIREFFNLLNTDVRFSRKKYKVITARSDYGPVVQSRNSPASDLPKWIRFQFNESKQGYNDLFCPARVSKERSNLEHTFSIKCYAHTDSTFDKVPEQVSKWYVCNYTSLDNEYYLYGKNSKIVNIPFGVQDEQIPIEELCNSINRQQSFARTKLVYCNWQFYTLERYEAYNFLDMVSQYPGCQGEITCKRNRLHQEYLDDLASHRFVFCPRGNGLDSYRTLEVYYMGAIPIFELKDGIPQWVDDCKLPYVGIPDYRVLPLFLDGLKNLNVPPLVDFNLEKLNFSYWRNRIVESKV